MADWTFQKLVQADRATHEDLVLRQPAPPFESIEGWEFKGWNCLYPIATVYMKPAGFTRFIKGFFRKPGSDATKLHGYNIQVARGRVDEPWWEKKKGGKPKRHSFYEVLPPGAGEKFREKYPQAHYLNYGVPENGILDGKDIRDFLVQVTPDLLLGKAYFSLGPLRFPASFFVLERLRKSDYRP